MPPNICIHPYSLACAIDVKWSFSRRQLSIAATPRKGRLKSAGGRHGICIPISYGSNSHKHDSFLGSPVVDLERFTTWIIKRLLELSNSGSLPGVAGDFPDHQLLWYRMQNMEKLLSWAAQVAASPTANQFEGNNGGIGV